MSGEARKRLRWFRIGFEYGREGARWTFTLWLGARSKTWESKP